MGAGKCSASRFSFARWTSEADRIILNPTLFLKNGWLPIAMDRENQDTSVDGNVKFMILY